MGTRRQAPDERERYLLDALRVHLPSIFPGKNCSGIHDDRWVFVDVGEPNLGITVEALKDGELRVGLLCDPDGIQRDHLLELARTVQQCLASNELVLPAAMQIGSTPGDARPGVQRSLFLQWILPFDANFRRVSFESQWPRAVEALRWLWTMLETTPHRFTLHARPRWPPV
jgi:hypothetical protein